MPQPWQGTASSTVMKVDESDEERDVTYDLFAYWVCAAQGTPSANLLEAATFANEPYVTQYARRNTIWKLSPA